MSRYSASFLLCFVPLISSHRVPSKHVDIITERIQTAAKSEDENYSRWLVSYINRKAFGTIAGSEMSTQLCDKWASYLSNQGPLFQLWCYTRLCAGKQDGTQIDGYEITHDGQGALFLLHGRWSQGAPRPTGVRYLWFKKTVDKTHLSQTSGTLTTLVQ